MPRTPKLKLTIGAAAGLTTLFLLLLQLQLLQPAPLLANQWEAKVSPSLLTLIDAANTDTQTLTNSDNKVEMLVVMNARADVSAAGTQPDKESKTAFVYSQLRAVAARSQQGLQRELASADVTHRPYWIVNAIWIEATPDWIEKLAQREDVAYIHANPSFQLDAPQQESDRASAAAAIEWGVERINAPDVWAAGFTGQSVIIGGQDTGYQWDHIALLNQYRGWDGSSADHNYNWHDSIHGDISGNGTNTRCGFDALAPCDDHGHGTHTMGTMVGDAGSNQIGVAPGAEWISCRSMDDGWGTPTTYIECFEWFMAPTDLDGNNPTPSLAPHVINNSWSCPTVEGCNAGNFAVMEEVVDNLRSAGIFVVSSAGNDGSSCESVSNPPSMFASTFSIGNTTSTDAINNSSSRGPVTLYMPDGQPVMKPNLSAPGTSVRSAYRNDLYATLTGTSMASPHVAGAIALLISADPTLAGDIDRIEELLTTTALPLTSNQGCGTDTPTSVPNNVYGYGRLDVFAAFQKLQEQQPISLGLELSAPTSMQAPFSESTFAHSIPYTISINNRHPISTAIGVIVTNTLPADTVLINATQPYTQTGRTISWSIEKIAAQATTSVTITVGYTTTASVNHTIINSEYGVVADNADPVSGSPVETQLHHIQYHLHLPFISREP